MQHPARACFLLALSKLGDSGGGKTIWRGACLGGPAVACAVVAGGLFPLPYSLCSTSSVSP